MTKPKTHAKLKSNSCYGTPGSDEFRCKLPKHITISSINTILSHLLVHDIANATLDDELVDYLTSELELIYLYSRAKDPPSTSDKAYTKDSLSDDSSRTEDPLVLNPCVKHYSSSAYSHAQSTEASSMYTNSELSKKLDDLSNEFKVFQLQVNELLTRMHSNYVSESTSKHIDIIEDSDTTLHPSESRRPPDDLPLTEPPLQFPAASTGDGTDHAKSDIDKQLDEYRNRHRQKFINELLNRKEHTVNLEPEVVTNEIKMSSATLVIGDSIIKHLKPMSLSSENVRVFCKTLPGARVENVFEHAHLLANKYRANEVVLHIGTNNLVNTDPSMLVAQIESLGDQILANCSTVSAIVLSSIIPRKTFQKELEWKTYEANWLLHQLAVRREWKFIEHEAIDPEKHLASDGIHLNAEGARLLGCAISAHIHGVSRTLRTGLLPGNPCDVSFQEREQYANVLARSNRESQHLTPSVMLNHRRSNMNPYTGCYNCGELNHKQRNCKYEFKLKCNSCFQFGHKAKFCSSCQNY